jgi:hypothetical protein
MRAAALSNAGKGERLPKTVDRLVAAAAYRRPKAVKSAASARLCGPWRSVRLITPAGKTI